MSRREEQTLYILAKEKLMNMGIPCSTTRSVIVARVAGYLMVEKPEDPIPMLQEFVKPTRVENKVTSKGEYKMPIGMRIAAKRAESHPSFVSMSSRVKHYQDN